MHTADDEMTSFELFDTAPTVDVREAEYMRLLGYPRGYTLEGRAQELASWAHKWYQEHGKPWIYARQVQEVEFDKKSVRVAGATFSPGRLAEKMVQAHATSVMLVAVSTGPECEETARRLWDEGKPDEYFFLEIYGSAVVEQLVAAASYLLCEWADQHHAAVLPHYSPGYPGWGITDQQALLRLIVEKPGLLLNERISAFDTGMLKPKKSMLAVFGITYRPELVPKLTELIPCENCSLLGCQYRRAPQKYSLPRLEQVRNWQQKRKTEV
ncbi:MAG: hypothetical protein L0Y80_03790 [Ignavibacteriae bacterium]|nr:hypothetical protein [Ignavibacteriota bacterium]